MKTLFKISLLLFSVVTFAQKHTVLNEVFETDTNTTAMLNLTDTYVMIEESTDGNMHFNYTLSFENYKKKEIEKELEKINVEVSEFENNIHLKSSSIINTRVIYKIEEENGLTIEDDFFGKSSAKKNEFKRKSKDSILRLINRTPKERLENFLKIFKVIDEKGKKRKINSKNVKTKRSVFVIKVPPYVKLNILAEKSNITFKNDVQNELNITMTDGNLKAKHLANSNNTIELSEGNLEVESIANGNYTFKNLSEGLIASAQNVTINSEFSKIEFGEIGENVKITDFNSELWFHNFTSNFERFDVKAEYTKVNLFYPKDDYSMDAFGHNTIHYLGETKITMQPNKKGEKFKMMQKEPRKEGTFAGALNFDIIHGIIRSDDELITINN